MSTPKYFFSTDLAGGEQFVCVGFYCDGVTFIQLRKHRVNSFRNNFWKGQELKGAVQRGDGVIIPLSVQETAGLGINVMV